jgi:hypothetical protein
MRKGLWFSTKLRVTKNGMHNKYARFQKRQLANKKTELLWRQCIERGGPLNATIGLLPTHIPSPILHPEQSAFPCNWKEGDGLPTLHLKGKSTHDSAHPEIITWFGVPLKGPPPKKFYQERARYIFLPAEGVCFNCKKGQMYVPMLSAAVVARLASLNQRIPAFPGQDRHFGLEYPKLDDNGDFFDNGVFYFVTPCLFFRQLGKPDM